METGEGDPEQILPSQLSEGIHSADTLTSNFYLDLQNCGTINFCCFSQFVVLGYGNPRKYTQSFLIFWDLDTFEECYLVKGLSIWISLMFPHGWNKVMEVMRLSPASCQRAYDIDTSHYCR